MKKSINFFPVLVLMLVLFVSGCGLGIPYAVKIGPDAVGVEEFRFYFLLSQRAYEEEGGTDIWETNINGLKAEEVAKDRALESLTVVRISCMQANSFGVSLTDEDKEKALEMAETYKLTLGDTDLSAINISEEQMRKIMEDTILYRKVFNEVTKNVIVSESDFNEYFNEYIIKDEEKIDENEDIDTLRVKLREQYLDIMKNDVFSEQFSKWRANTQIVKDAEVWDSITILSH